MNTRYHIGHKLSDLINGSDKKKENVELVIGLDEEKTELVNILLKDIEAGRIAALKTDGTLLCYKPSDIEIVFDVL